MEENKLQRVENQKVNIEEFRMLIDMVKEVDEECRMLKTTLESQLKLQNGLKFDIVEKMLCYSNEEIESMSKDEIIEILNQYKEDIDYTDKSEEEIRNAIKVAKESSIVYYTTKDEADKIKESSNEVINEYFNYMTSDKIAKSREARLEAMKKAAEDETDKGKKATILKLIKTMESSFSFDFLKTRFDKLGKKEIENIMDGFFSKDNGDYVLKRFNNKCKNFNINPNMYKYFFNIEENFLSKKYSVYNNLILFIYIRMIAFSDPYKKEDKLFVQSFTGALSNLVYHRFGNIESESVFKNVMMEVLDMFEEYRDVFEENNTLYENHPERKKLEAEHEETRKNEIKEKLNNLNIDYDDSLTSTELQTIYNTEITNLIRTQIEENKDIETEEEPTDEVEGTVTE